MQSWVTVYREEHSSIFLNVRGLHDVVPADQVVLDVVLLEGAEEAGAAQAAVLELPPVGQRAQAGLRLGLAHGPAPGGPGRGDSVHWGLRSPRGRFPVRPQAGADVVELLDALVDQGRRGLLVCHGHSATEEDLELLGKGVVELRRAAQLLLAGDLPSLADGADDLWHLRGSSSVTGSLKPDPTPHCPHRCQGHLAWRKTCNLESAAEGNSTDAPRHLQG